MNNRQVKRTKNALAQGLTIIRSIENLSKEEIINQWVKL